MTIVQAIAKVEGWQATAANIPTRDNNPGDIVAGKFATAHKALRAAGRFAVFATPEDGFAALSDLLKAHYAGMTLEAAVNKYAPPIENDTMHYVNMVCGFTGLTPSSILTAENIG